MGDAAASGLASFGVWWAWALVLGLFAAPVGAWLFPGAGDRGYLAGKALALIAVGFVPWWLASWHILSFSQSGPILAPLAVAGAGFWAWARGHRPDWRAVALGEALFLALFVVGTAIRAADPEIETLEKFMDFGFMNAAMRADAMPPEDMWMSGRPINYYYFGHAMAGMWALITQVPPDHAYNLAMGMLFALTGCLSFRLVADALAGGRMGRVAGGFAALLAVLGGNFHVVVYGLFRPWSGSETGRPDFFYPDSTRYIGYDPPTDDRAFTEFPSYGFAVGDMHGHVLALPVILLGLLLLMAMIARDPVTRIRMPHAALFGLLWGISYMTNSWDLAILGLVALLTAIVLWGRTGWSFRALDRIGAAALVILAGAALAAGPFQQSFEPFVQGVRLTETRTPGWQLLVVYGHVLLPCALLAVAPFFPSLRTRGLLFASVLAWAVLLMIVIAETVYVKDFYGPEFARANTMFKLSFRGQMFAVLAACVLMGALAQAKPRMGFIAAMILALPLAGVLTYPGWALEGRFTPDRIARYTLDGLGHMDRTAPADRALAAFLREAPYGPGEIMLEADGQSYSYDARLSAATGVPTILGWFNHEWFWRGDLELVRRRSEAVRTIYTGTDFAERCRLIGRFHVRYIVVGAKERERFPTLDTDDLLQFGPVLFETGTAQVIGTRAGGLCPQTH